MRFLRQSTATTVRVGPYLSISDGFTPASGLTIQSGTLTKNGTSGAWTPASWSYSTNGHATVGFAVGDTDTIGRLRAEWNDPSAFVPVWEDFAVLSAAVYDWLFGTTAPNTVVPDNAD